MSGATAQAGIPCRKLGRRPKSSGVSLVAVTSGLGTEPDVLKVWGTAGSFLKDGLSGDDPRTSCSDTGLPGLHAQAASSLTALIRASASFGVWPGLD